MVACGVSYYPPVTHIAYSASVRTVKEVTNRTGAIAYQVRFRLAKAQTSKTFVAREDAQTFAAIMDAGGVEEALAWLDARNSGERSAYTWATWFDHYVTNLTGVTKRTKADYRRDARNHLSSLDELPLNLITRAHAAAVVNTMDAAGAAPKTIKNVAYMLASALAAAVEEGHLGRNPARKVRLPEAKAIADDDDDGEDARFLTFEEFARLLAEVPEQWRPLVVFLVGTGLRWSEATALQARHVDLREGVVRVRRAWKRVPGEGFAIGPPKSAKSRRTVNAAVQAMTAVTPLLGKPNELVFRTVTGKRVTHANFFNRVWRPAVVRASVCTQHMPEGCRCGTSRANTCAVHPGKGETVPPCGCAGTINPRPRLHDLRHTHASWLISEGMSLEQVQDQLGHESILTTRKVYGHLLPALGVKTGKAAGKALKRALGQTALVDAGQPRHALRG